MSNGAAQLCSKIKRASMREYDLNRDATRREWCRVILASKVEKMDVY